ncbi:PAS domain-containing sensor histidine kinase (plasmid) [Haloferax mediterranei ATCC 33500]|uniref:histidine kinase n=1 Tax=Haloferax mediterranei (strain ATCC 33500 / DSM 1411 / JCM 8866 / NBRC 14739 / NCIMB 2177 / R-4) TaxID=523841 RepID=I3RAI9_HALMT|nr:PAS domain-containing sensor histidine kinase [Haloferax mediterranei]AFK21249.1 multi-sensor signal transduction histidine kinase [Haloferax mediterranei ATCC 33500]AHZ24650.1 histidine kinase [Haloferax mediterranei ATCC 33500]ELZ97421.1 multi-sensor signal transduction histidine kinase [Haloferax mediterranei ATCC 33500]MDX5990284.1 ATP-binding protein [Haloferax mediterranei ATCC 33500]QCQ77045.1 PAS domain-containing sensor histidine kinase [Haloferax mediterranei ATCC 33500]
MTDTHDSTHIVRTVVQHLPEGILVEDASRNILATNERLVEMFGLERSPSELVGMNCERLAESVAYLFVDSEAFVSAIDETLEHREQIDREEFKLTDGRVFEQSYVPYTLPEGPANLWVYRDVTDDKEYERLIGRQNERLEEFASVVSHDLRNPLNVIQGRLELALERHDNDEDLQKAAEALDRTFELINDLLMLAREGTAVRDPGRIVLADVVTRCWGTVETGEATLAVDTNHVVRADESQVKQLLENLIRNAIEHGGDGVTVSVGSLADGFYVEDDGHGIPADDWNQIFSTGYSTSPEGTGFGLSIVQTVVHNHGWEIGVTESQSGGARFEITGVTVLDSTS